MSTPYITLIMAPDVPTTEREALEKHWREAELDPDYTVITNYDVRVDLIPLPPNAKVLVTAPGIPVSEIKILREKIDAARAAEAQVDRLIVLNYEVRIDTISPDELTAVYNA